MDFNKNSRPVNLNLHQMHFPLNAICSILHRITGVINFFGLGIILFLLAFITNNQVPVSEIQSFTSHFFIKLILWAISVSFAYHTLMGVRHLFMDLGFFEELDSADFSAKITLGSFALLSIILGGVILL